MDMTSLAAAFESLKIVAGVAKATSEAAVDHQIKGRLIEIQHGILEVQGQLADATEERLALLYQVAELRRKVGEFEAAKAALDAYELCEVVPGEYLYKAREGQGHSVSHYACPSCFSAGRIAVLKVLPNGGRVFHFSCLSTSCTFNTQVRLPDPEGASSEP